MSKSMVMEVKLTKKPAKRFFYSVLLNYLKKKKNTIKRSVLYYCGFPNSKLIMLS